MRQFIKLITLIVLPLQVGANQAFAEDEICAAVYPCLENGEILPEFNQPGYCGDHYRAVCLKSKASLMSDGLVAWQKENEKFKNDGVRLSKKIRNLRRKLSQSK